MSAAKQKRPARPKTERVRLAKALRDAVAPLMRAYGYDHPTTEVARNYLCYRPDIWQRRRDGVVDVVSIEWPWNERPLFRIEWEVRQDWLGGESDVHYGAGELLARRWKWGPFEQFNGDFRSRGKIDAIVAVALERLKELEEGLRTSVPGFHMLVRGPPWPQDQLPLGFFETPPEVNGRSLAPWSPYRRAARRRGWAHRFGGPIVLYPSTIGRAITVASSSGFFLWLGFLQLFGISEASPIGPAGFFVVGAFGVGLGMYGEVSAGLKAAAATFLLFGGAWIVGALLRN